MKNSFQSSVNESVNHIKERNHWNFYYKRFLNNILLQVDTIAIISILFGGLLAVGKDTRPIGIGFIIAGFGGLLIYLNKDMSLRKKL